MTPGEEVEFLSGQEEMLRGRIEELEEMLNARTDFDGKPRPGYATNVAMIQTEIRRLQRIEEHHNDDGA